MSPREYLSRRVLVRGHGAQAQLARRLNVNPQTITKWLKGETNVPHHRWVDIDDALGDPPLTMATAVGLAEQLGWSDLDADEIRRRWKATYPPPQGVSGTVAVTLEPFTSTAIGTVGEIHLSASGRDLEELRQTDPEAYQQLVDLARLHLDRARARREQP